MCWPRTLPSGPSPRPPPCLPRAAYNHSLAHAPRIWYDEWNVWFRNMTGALEERFVHADALAVGLYLKSSCATAPGWRWPTVAQMVNAIAPIVTTAETAAVQPIYYPFLLHAQGHLETAVDAFVEGPRVEPPAEIQGNGPTRSLTSGRSRLSTRRRPLTRSGAAWRSP